MRQRNVLYHMMAAVELGEVKPYCARGNGCRRNVFVAFKITKDL